MVPKAIVLTLAVLSIACTVHGQTPIYFDPQDASIAGASCQDTLFCVEVNIGPAADIKGYDVVIVMDPYYLDVADVPEGDIFSSHGHLSGYFWRRGHGPVVDTILVNNSDFTGSVPGPGHLFSLCFEPPWNCIEQAQMNFFSAAVRDSANQDVDVTTTDGTVTIRCGATAATGHRWGTIKSLYK